SIKAVVVLPNALIKDAGTAADCRLTIPEQVISKTKARAEVVPAVVSAALRQSACPLANHAVIRIPRARNNRALQRNLSRHIRSRVNRDCLCRIVAVRLKVVLVER